MSMRSRKREKFKSGKGLESYEDRNRACPASILNNSEGESIGLNGTLVNLNCPWFCKGTMTPIVSLS